MTMFPSIAELRRRREQLTEVELWQRCRSAARLELRGANWSSDDRDECAATIMAEGLAQTNGATPTRSDPKHSLSAYCGKAKNFRRKVEADRARDQKALEAEQDGYARSFDALIPEKTETATEKARETAATVCRRLGMAANGVIFTLFYGYARDLPTAVCAHELGLQGTAYDMQCSRARALIRAAYPTALDFLDALAGGAVYVEDWATHETILRFVLQDDSTEAKRPKHLISQPDWRDGTDQGSWPVRAESVEDARRVCEVRWRKAAPKIAEQNRRKAYRNTSELEVQAESLRLLGRALAA